MQQFPDARHLRLTVPCLHAHSCEGRLPNCEWLQIIFKEKLAHDVIHFYTIDYKRLTTNDTEQKKPHNH